MLLECKIIDDEGSILEVENEDVQLTHNSTVIIIAHDNRKIYLFKGKDVSLVQKFSSAREASRFRLQHGYNIKHIEESEGIDDEFVPIMEFLGGIAEGEKKEEKTTTKANKTAPAKKTAPKKAAPKKVTPPKKATPAKKTAPKKAAPKKVTPPKKATPAKKEIIDLPKDLNDLPGNLTNVVKTMMALEPPIKASCDYLLVDSKLYIVLGDNKQDMRKGEFKLEEISTLPEGVFPAENYFPRILIAEQQIIGVELWTKK
jgi:hypothetical protein